MRILLFIAMLACPSANAVWKTCGELLSTRGIIREFPHGKMLIWTIKDNRELFESVSKAELESSRLGRENQSQISFVPPSTLNLLEVSLREVMRRLLDREDNDEMSILLFRNTALGLIRIYSFLGEPNLFEQSSEVTNLMRALSRDNWSLIFLISGYANESHVANFPNAPQVNQLIEWRNAFGFEALRILDANRVIVLDANQLHLKFHE